VELAGYGQEIRSRDSFNMGVELLWGSTDWPDQRYADNLMPGATSREFFWTAVPSWGPVYLEAHGDLNLPVPSYITQALNPPKPAVPPVPITYNLPKDALVTVAINDAQGNRVRNLIPALPRTQGPNTEYWDGLDDNGKECSSRRL